MATVVRYFDGRERVEIDADEFELVKMMLDDIDNTINPHKKVGIVTKALEQQGWEHFRALKVVILAKNQP